MGAYRQAAEILYAEKLIRDKTSSCSPKTDWMTGR
jgi:hypothetical protein